MLKSYLPIEVVGYYSGHEPDGNLACPSGHTVLVDTSIGSDSVLVWTRYWSSRLQQSFVIVLELRDDPGLILSCIEAGACGYTLRGATVADVAHTIECAHRGEAYCSPALTAHLFTRLATRGPAPSDDIPLTTRELEVLRLIVLNYSNQAIADALVIEVRTVKHHVHNILGKLKLRHRGEAACHATALGWIH